MAASRPIKFFFSKQFKNSGQVIYSTTKQLIGPRMPPSMRILNIIFVYEIILVHTPLLISLHPGPPPQLNNIV